MKRYILVYTIDTSWYQILSPKDENSVAISPLVSNWSRCLENVL